MIDLTVTSPPYDNIREYDGYSFDFEALAKQLYRVTKPGGRLVWIVVDQTKDHDKSRLRRLNRLYFLKPLDSRLNDNIIFLPILVHQTYNTSKLQKTCLSYLRGRPTLPI